jgi:GalNAc-alpha-(1->4)-GalNAc-alpha-(1->3)-diNAcBac-PP-undecaprenol alpha-1,4-N-acetyl-D-galactosaminyltransferase
MKSKHILIINNGLAGGGIERASVSLANYFLSKGNQVSVLALYQSTPFFTLSVNVKFQEPDFPRENTSKLMYLAKMIKYLRKSIKLIKPDTILAFGEWTNPFVLLSLRGTNYPVFVSDRMNPLAKLPALSEFLRKILYKKATGIIAQSNFAKSVLSKKTKSTNIHVIYNPVNVIEKLQCEQKNRIVSVGRLEEVKGHQILIEAFAKLDNFDWELSIVGDGSWRNKLENLAKDLRVHNRVIFHGHLKDFRLQLSEAQIFVLPSLKEGFPNALIEAMSLPIACIASDTFNGHHEIITNGENGLLVQPGDVMELTNALELLIKNKQKRDKLKEKALEVREKLNFEVIANQYLKVILS